MRWAVFYRNLNLGRANSPDRTQFEAAFLEAGAPFAASFQVNGNLVFEARNAASARAITKRASALMLKSCGLREPAFVRDLRDLQALVDRDPFAGIDPASVYGCYVSFFDAKPAAEALPKASARGDVQLMLQTEDAALCLSHQLGASPGSPNDFVEKLLARPASTRVWGTILRLLKKHA